MGPNANLNPQYWQALNRVVMVIFGGTLHATALIIV